MANKSSKGGEFEREFSKTFSKWLTKGERDDLFWRSSQSGGRATTRAKTGRTTEGSYGDIACLDSSYAYVTEVLCFELKRGYNGTGVLDIMDGTKKEPEIIAFWRQCERDRILGNRKHSFVVFKRDRKKPVIITSQFFHRTLSRWVKPMYNRIEISWRRDRLCMFPMDDFFASCDPFVFSNMLKDMKDA